MKRVVYILFITFLAVATGCKKDVISGPGIKISTPAGGTLGKGPYGNNNVIKVKVTGEKGDSPLRLLEVYFAQNLSKGTSFDNDPVFTKILINEDKQALSDTVSLNTGGFYGNYVYRFVVTDDNGNTADTDFELIIQP